MSSAQWIASLSCSPPVIQTSAATFISALPRWLRFVFLTPCPQRVLLSSVNILLLLVFFVLAIQKLYSRFASNGDGKSDLNTPLIRHNRASLRTTAWFRLTLTSTLVLVVLYTISCILVFTSASQARWKQINGIFWLVQAVTQSVIAILIVHERRFKALSHPVSLRVYWFANFIIISLFTVSGIIRFVSLTETKDFDFKMDDVVSFVSLPLSLFLLLAAIKGATGIRSNEEESQPLVNGERKLHELTLSESNVTAFASASIVSKAFWLWINPLLSKGYKSPLKIDEVPSLSPEHRAEKMSVLFETKWPKPQERSKHPVRTTLLRCFWKQAAFTAFLAIVLFCAMFVGPVLIQNFVDYASGKRSPVYEGYYLVLILLCAKFIEVLATNHFNFNSQKFGMLIRCTLITSLYKKGLRLTGSAH